MCKSSAAIMLLAKLPTKFAYNSAILFGDIQFVLNKVSAYGLHADWNELIISFCDSR